jgi:hypothetical protein
MLAAPAQGKFLNDRRLSEPEIEILTALADTVAKPGSAKDAAKPLQFAQGWEIGTPDLVFEMPAAFEVFPPTSPKTSGCRLPRRVRRTVSRAPRRKKNGGERRAGENGGFADLLVGFAPGTPPSTFKPVKRNSSRPEAI